MKLFLAIFLLYSIQIAYSQVSIANDGSLPHSSAQLEVKASNKGLLLPRVNPANVSNPTAGLLLYNNTNTKLSYYNGSNWANLTTNQSLYDRFPNSVGFKGEIYASLPSYTEYTWVVPASIGNIWIEAWGAGDAGLTISNANTTSSTTVGYKGGDAGDFASFIMQVTPGETLTIRVGKGGSASNASGGISEILSLLAPTKTYRIGQIQTMVSYLENSINMSQIPNLLQFVAGQAGQYSTVRYEQSGATEFRRVMTGGKGGDSFPGQKGSDGITISYDVATGSHLMGSLISVTGRPAASPGAGGGVNFGTTCSGGSGLVILHW
jgi:hypothetical protein